VPFWHNLDALRNLLPPGWSVKQEHPDLAELTAWAVEARYPGDWPEATWRMPTAQWLWQGRSTTASSGTSSNAG
jgi:hypothetical protein